MNNLVVEVWCRFTFPCLHGWSEAEGDVYYLKYPHRHLFYVEAGARVDGVNREIEFITLQEKLKAYVKKTYENRFTDKSCEMIAADILEKFPELHYVLVSEDNENGARVSRRT